MGQYCLLSCNGFMKHLIIDDLSYTIKFIINLGTDSIIAANSLLWEKGLVIIKSLAGLLVLF